MSVPARIAVAFSLALASSLLAPPSTSAQTIDRVRRQNGLDSGQVTATSPLGVTLSRGGVETTIPVEDVVSVQWGGEPAALATARNALDAGRYADAARMLAGLVVPATARSEIKADVAYYQALVAVRSALDEAGDAAAAARHMETFLKEHPRSFHAAAALEALGDALVAAGQHDAARTQYAKLARAKSLYLATRSAWLVGQAWQSQGDHAQALAEFDKVRTAAATGEAFDALKMTASFDEAVSQAATGKIADAAARLTEFIDGIKPDDAELAARAYNALGRAYLAADDPRAALFAFLHVELLYPQVEREHAEALHELVALWRTLGRDARSQQAAEELASKYPNRKWER